MLKRGGCSDRGASCGDFAPGAVTFELGAGSEGAFDAAQDSAAGNRDASPALVRFRVRWR